MNDVQLQILKKLDHQKLGMDHFSKVYAQTGMLPLYAAITQHIPLWFDSQSVQSVPTGLLVDIPSRLIGLIVPWQPLVSSRQIDVAGSPVYWVPGNGAELTVPLRRTLPIVSYERSIGENVSEGQIGMRCDHQAINAGDRIASLIFIERPITRIRYNFED